MSIGHNPFPALSRNSLQCSALHNVARPDKLLRWGQPVVSSAHVGCDDRKVTTPVSFWNDAVARLKNNYRAPDVGLVRGRIFKLAGLGNVSGTDLRKCRLTKRAYE